VKKHRPLVAVVDDEDPIRKALMRLLRSAGLDAVEYSSGGEFLDSLSHRRPDCVVLDLHMPVVSGFMVQARLAESGLPVVIITGHDSDETRDRALAGKPAAYLRKPFHDQSLLDAIELALGHHPRS
jgi:FixJ family two-component response regulator